MSDVEISGMKYRIAKMNIFDQAHVARKVAPVVFTLGKGYMEAVAKISRGMPPSPQAEPEPSTAPNGANGGSGNGLDHVVEAEPEGPPQQIPDDPEEVSRQSQIFFEAMTPIAEMLAHMEEQDVDYVLKKCLSVVSKHNGNSYVPMMRSGNLMFEDLDLSTMIQLTMEVVQDNLGPSLLALLPLSSAAAASVSRSTSPA